MMFTLLEKLKFILTTKLRLKLPRKRFRFTKEDDKHWVKILKRLFWTIAITFGLLMILGAIGYYFMPPTIYVSGSDQKLIRTRNSTYVINGTVSGHESMLKVNDKNIEVINGDFTRSVNLKEGDNKFNFEASNSRGTTKEAYIIRYTAR